MGVDGRSLGLLLVVLVVTMTNRLEANDKLYQYALVQGLVEGIRAVELIRPDLLAVTIDPGLSKCAPEPGAAEAFTKPELFTITSQTDAAYRSGVHPSEVGQESFERFNFVAPGPFKFRGMIWWHCYYLKLDRPLTSGHAYTIAVEGIDAPLKAAADLDYDDQKTTGKAFKINQVGYSDQASTRYAYLGWWAGDHGPVDYADLKRFEVVDEATGRAVLEGDIEPRAIGDTDFSGEDVYQMDISALDAGRYHIRVPGLARSETFVVGLPGVKALYYHTMRGFFYQRCGQEFGPPWTEIRKPACHTEVWESGHVVDGPGRIVCLWKIDREPYQPKPGEAKRSFRGGYHDAADFDTFSYHLPSTAETLIAYEMHPSAFHDGDLNLPESGNGIPDILDEAEWGLLFFMENQYDNGAVPLGRGNDCDGFKQNVSGPRLPPYGVLPPMRGSTPTFAAVAAQYARCVEPFDKARATRHLEAAKKAFAYASTHTPAQVRDAFSTNGMQLSNKGDGDWQRDLCWAAAELYKTTGDEQYNRYLLEHAKAVRHYWNRGIRYFAYLTCEHPGVDADLKQTMLNGLIQDAEKAIRKQAECPYRMSLGAFDGAGWGGAQGVNHNEELLVAFHVTGEQKYLDAASLNADWHLGCNPAGQTFITGMGYRHPNRPEISWFLYEDGRNDMRGAVVPGIAIYGIGPAKKFYKPPCPPGGVSATCGARARRCGTSSPSPSARARRQ